MDPSNYQQNDSERLFSEYYEKLVKEIQYARAHLVLWQHLTDSISSYNREINQARYFFRFTIKSHLDDAVLTLARILDEHEDSLSIWKFLNYAEQNIGIFSDESFKKHIEGRDFFDEMIKSHVPITLGDIQGHRNRLEDLKVVIKDIKDWRDKSLAHIDRTFHLKGKNITVKRNNLNEVIETIITILNSYSQAYDRSSNSVRYVGEDDYIGVLNALRFRQEEAKRQLEAYKNKTSS